MDASTQIATETLIAAWTRQFYADPKLAYEALTGHCEWDASTPASVIEQWSIAAEDKAYDLKLLNPGWAYGRTPDLATRIRKLEAAAEAFASLAVDREREERIERWAGEDGACIRPAPYLQGEFV
jgi:hypothetical protein